MTNKPLSARKQTGIALVMLLVLLVLGGAFAFYWSANLDFGRSAQDTKLTLALARAKEALIAYAVIDDKRPGRMLCPDIIGEGNSDWSLSRTYCDTSSGWLPWKTLGLTEGTDDHGTKFWYAFTPVFSGTQGTPLNSDTLTSIHVDVPAGSPSNDVVAVIIATRGALDTRNADGDDYYYSGTSTAPDDNDVIAVVTRQELMAAVEKRIANEVKACLEGHATFADNTSHTYPWPAPLSNSIFKGVSDSFFGMVPETQPGNPDDALKQTFNSLSTSKNSLNLALTANDLATQKAVILEIQEIAAYARAQFDRLFIVATALKKAADEAAKVEFCNAPSPQPNFKTLDQIFQSATANATAFTDSGASLSDATKGTLPTFAPLLEALVNSGFDLFTSELQAQNDILISRREAVPTAPDADPLETLNALKGQINSIRNGALEYSASSNSALKLGLVSALKDAKLARDNTLDATKSPITWEKTSLALTSTDALIASNSALLTIVKALSYRPDLIEQAGEIIIRSNQLTDQAIQLTTNITDTERNNLKFLTENARALVNSIQPSSDLSILHGDALSQLDFALNILRNLGESRTNITTSVVNASKAMSLYANAIYPDPAREALIAFKANLVDSITSPPRTLTAAELLNDQIKGILFWAKLASSQANDIAKLARKGICNISDGNNSSYTAARKLLDSIDGESGSLAAIDKQSASSAEKIAETSTLLNSLIDKTTALEQSLNAPYAAGAVPTIWHGGTCGILKPPTGTPTWWSANGWASLFFYQISDHIRPATGKLKVNGSGTYPVVVIAAGRAFPSQNRNTRIIDNFLEKENADASRNGNATNPTPIFTSLPPILVPNPDDPNSKVFNDRLGY
jgi:hypothetical protein